MSLLDERRTDGLVHEAFPHSTREEMLGFVVPFLREGLEAGDAVALACGEETGDEIVEAVGDTRVSVLTRGFAMLRIPDALAVARDSVRAGAGRRLRVVGGLDYGSAVSGRTDWMRLESLLNRELAPFPLWLVCALDTSSLPADVVGTTLSAHPLLREHGTTRPNPAYLETSALMTRLSPGDPDPLQERPPDVTVPGVRSLVDVGRVRHAVLTALPPGAHDLVACIDEVVTNALEHGRPPVDLQLWVAPDRRRAVCAVRDRGTGIADPTVGYSARHLADDPEARLGLRIVRRLCDRMDHEQTHDGFVVRLSSSW